MSKEIEDLKKDLRQFDLKSRSNKEAIISRCRYPSFAKYCMHILKSYSEGKNKFYASEFIILNKISYTQSFRFFQDMENFGMMQEFSEGNKNYFKLIEVNGHILLLDYLPNLKASLSKKENGE